MEGIRLNLYLAARYSRREELLRYAVQLEHLGFTVTSRWIKGQHQLTDAQLDDGHRGHDGAADIQLGARYAQEDLIDLSHADIAVFFSERPRTSSSRGGRHVELGAALMLGKRCVVIGPAENVFMCLPEIERYASWADAVIHLVEEVCGWIRVGGRGRPSCILPLGHDGAHVDRGDWAS